MGTDRNVGEFKPQDWAFCGVFGAAALLLPLVFHVLHLGHVFLPMYIPLFALALITRPIPSGLTSALVPVLSAVLTGMPPLYPPIAWIMAVELAAMVSATSFLAVRLPKRNPILIILPVLILGRVLNAVLYYGAASLMDLPAAFLAGLSFFSGWPGVVLILITTSAFARTLREHGPVGPSAL